MFSVSTFFDLPILTRFRWVTGVAAVLTILAMFVRLTLDAWTGRDFYPTELFAIVVLSSFSLLGHKIGWIRENPNAAMFFATAPWIANTLFILHDIGPDMRVLLVLGTYIAIIGMLMEDNAWRRNFTITWAASTVAVLFMSPIGPVSMLVVSGLFVIISLIICVVGGSFYTARQNLASAVQLLDEALAYSGVGAWQLEVATGKVRWTKTVYEILDVEEDQEPTLDLTQFLIGAKEDSKLDQATQHMITTGEPYDVVDRVRTAKGREIWIQCRGRIVIEHGKAQRAIGVFSDISSQVEHELELTKARDAAEAAAHARSRFLANMSHEIRTPMNGVVGMASLLSQLDLSDQVRQHVDVIRSSGESLLTIINDILDFSKAEAGKLQLETRPFQLGSLVESALDVFRQAAQEKGLKLTTILPEDDGTDYLGDDTRLRQVLINLLSNALKFTASGEISVRVNTQQDDSASSWVAFTVTDTGTGIAKEKQSTLFDAFTQEDTSTTREFGGTGLGLAICKQIISQMDGTITVDSDRGAGASFRFQLRLPSTQRAQPKNLNEHLTEQRVEFDEHLRVLLAEDNPVNQKVAVLMLNRLGYDADVADNGVEVLAAVSKAEYDVIFMDLQMPELDGLEATRIIRANNAVHQPRIIALTANALPEHKQQCLDAGMDLFLTKPMRLSDLESALAEAAAL